MAVQLAEALAAKGRKGVIINADSAQVYADLQILSARPSAAEMRGIEHRLFGMWDGAAACSAADWAQAARAEIDAVHRDGGIPVLVGGTGLYIRTLLDGIAPVPPIDPAIRASVRALPVPDAYAALIKEDPARAARLAPADTTRVARALEVVRSTGRVMAAWQAEKVGGIAGQVALHPAVLLPSRAWLYDRCDRRFSKMLGCGAIDEVRALIDRQIDTAMPVMRAIGVPEISDFLAGKIDFAVLEARGAQATRNYAKRQYTWFRQQTPDTWPRLADIDYNLDDIFASLCRT